MVTTTTKSIKDWPIRDGTHPRPSPTLGAAQTWGRMPMQIKLRGACKGVARLVN